MFTAFAILVCGCDAVLVAFFNVIGLPGTSAPLGLVLRFFYWLVIRQAFGSECLGELRSVNCPAA